MPAYIRYIGVDGQVQRKLRQAAPIATMYSREANVAEWDGKPCDVVVAGTGDQSGRSAIDRATAEGIPVVAIGDGGERYGTYYNIPPKSSIADMTRALKVALDVTA